VAHLAPPRPARPSVPHRRQTSMAPLPSWRTPGLLHAGVESNDVHGPDSRAPPPWPPLPSQLSVSHLNSGAQAGALSRAGGAPAVVPSRTGGVAISLPASCSSCLWASPCLHATDLCRDGPTCDLGSERASALGASLAQRHDGTPCSQAGPTAHGPCLRPKARHEARSGTTREARRPAKARPPSGRHGTTSGRAGPERPVGHLYI
jgi:hypothetical protein